jgi:multidrug resistance protein, MATE family
MSKSTRRENPARQRSFRIGLKTTFSPTRTNPTVPSLILAVCVPRWFFAVFAPEWGLFANGRASLRVVALAMLVAIPGEMWFGAVLGTGDTLAALGIEFVLTATMLGIAYLTAIPLGWPVEWVWLSLPIAWAVVLFISYLWMRSRMWQRVHI